MDQALFTLGHCARCGESQRLRELCSFGLTLNLACDTEVDTVRGND